MAWAEKRTSGKWQGLYRLPSGKRASAGTFRLKTEAVKAASTAELRAQRVTGADPLAARLTWGDWCEKWWKARSVEPATLQNEESMVQTHLVPRWADVQLGQITRREVQTWANKILKAKRLAPSSLRRVLNVFVSSLSAAVDEGILDANPATGVQILNTGGGKEVYLSKEQFRALIESTVIVLETDGEGNPMRSTPDWHSRAILNLLAGSGMRWGELAGLHWEHLHNDHVEIRNVISGNGKAREIKPYPKGKASRTVPLLKWARVLIDWKDTKTQPLPYRNGAARPTTGLVFLSKTGGALDDRNFTNRVLEPARLRAGLPPFTLHDLRHTYASWLVQDGVPLERIAQLLGHASVKTTERYAHLRDAKIDDVRHALSDPFAPTLEVVDGRGHQRGANGGQD